MSTPAKTVISPLVMAATLPPAAPGLTGSPAGYRAVGPGGLPTHANRQRHGHQPPGRKRARNRRHRRTYWNRRVRNVNHYCTGHGAGNCPSTGWARGAGSASLYAGGRGRSSRSPALPCPRWPSAEHNLLLRQGLLPSLTESSTKQGHTCRRRLRHRGPFFGRIVKAFSEHRALLPSPGQVMGLDGSAAIRRRPPCAGVVRAVGPHPPGRPRSGVQQECPLPPARSARPPEGWHPTTVSGRPVVLRRPRCLP